MNIHELTVALSLVKEYGKALGYKQGKIIRPLYHKSFSQMKKDAEEYSAKLYAEMRAE